MYGSRHQFLPRSGFTQQQDGRIGRSHYPRLFQHVAQSGTMPDNFFEPQLRLNLTFQIGFFLKQFVPGILQAVGELAEPRYVHGSDRNSNHASIDIKQGLNREIDNATSVPAREHHFGSQSLFSF